jgi:hypothetical protein
MKKSEIFKRLYSNLKKRDQFVDTLPPYFQEVVFDNDYSTLLQDDNFMMIEKIFGDHTEAIMWFMYEWTPGMKSYPTKEHYGIAIQSIEMYIDYLEMYEGFKDE